MGGFHRFLCACDLFERRNIFVGSSSGSCDDGWRGSWFTPREARRRQREDLKFNRGGWFRTADEIRITIFEKPIEFCFPILFYCVWMRKEERKENTDPILSNNHTKPSLVTTCLPLTASYKLTQLKTKKLKPGVLSTRSPLVTKEYCCSQMSWGLRQALWCSHTLLSSVGIDEHHFCITGSFYCPK